MFNSREYEFADITVITGGKDIIGLRGVKYSNKQDKEAIYGKGNLPISIQKGNKSYEGELSLLQSELETLEANSPKRDLMNLQFDMVVCYGNPSNGDAMVTDKLIGCQFTEETKEMKQGDKFMEVSLPFIFLRKE
ncbi:MAG: hypothetical protein J6Y55_11065 [Bacteroidales bacterium]|nr:hypothetical protein [Bacteroidales bacterium]